MKFKKLLTKKGIIFLLIFSILTFVAEKINFSPLIGAENQFFTLFQFFGPVAGFFLGPVVGVLSVLITESASFLVAGKAFTLINLFRLLPMLFAAWYFGTKHKDKLSIAVPVLAIILFNLHPIGRQVWYFSLFWSIPIIIKFLPKNYGERAFFKSLGATFTAHAVGGSLWNYFVPMTPAMWITLIPIVIFERLVFASGITGSFVLLNSVLDRITVKKKNDYVDIDKRYVFFRKPVNA